MKTLEDVTNMIKDNIDRGDLEDAKDYLDQLNDYLAARSKKARSGGSPSDFTQPSITSILR